MPLSLFPRELFAGLSQTPGLTLGFEEAENVVLADCGTCVSILEGCAG
jgi:hypothetical protein